MSSNDEGRAVEMSAHVRSSSNTYRREIQTLCPSKSAETKPRCSKRNPNSFKNKKHNSRVTPCTPRLPTIQATVCVPLTTYVPPLIPILVVLDVGLGLELVVASVTITVFPSASVVVRTAASDPKALLLLLDLSFRILEPKIPSVMAAASMHSAAMTAPMIFHFGVPLGLDVGFEAGLWSSGMGLVGECEEGGDSMVEGVVWCCVWCVVCGGAHTIHQLEQ